MKSVHPTYDILVAAARARVTADRRLKALLDPTLDPARLHLYLMQFSAWGVQMTRPVESWIRRAGERCTACGYPELGQALVKHARHEADHDRMFLQDLASLVNSWNAAGHPPVSEAQFLDAPATGAMKRYIDLHEQVIASSEPFAQVAIEFEIEGMSTTLGPPLVAQCLQVLGPIAARGLSFLQEHVAIDVGHTAFNHKQLCRFLGQHPQAATRLGQTGAAALEAYVDFLGDCWDAVSDRERVRWSAAWRPGGRPAATASRPAPRR
jgi:hypothetical protein